MAQSAFATQPRPEILPRPDKGFEVLPFESPRHLFLGVELKPSRFRPHQILLGTVNDTDFRVIRAIPVRLEYRDGSVVANWDEVEEFGTGQSVSAACEDLGHTLAELYRSLQADRERLGPDLERVWSVLQNYLTRRQ